MNLLSQQTERVLSVVEIPPLLLLLLLLFHTKEYSMSMMAMVVMMVVVMMATRLTIKVLMLNGIPRSSA